MRHGIYSPLVLKMALAIAIGAPLSDGCSSSTDDGSVTPDDVLLPDGKQPSGDGSQSGIYAPPLCTDDGAEICDGFDNDCNGVTDDNYLLTCGACESGALGCHTAVIRGGAWDEGVHRNVVTGNDHGVYLPPPPARNEYVWIANSPQDSVSKVRASDGVEVGRFLVGDNPSRTAVDGNGDAWIAMRGGLNDTAKSPIASQPFENVVKIDGSCTPTIQPPFMTRECILLDIPDVGNLLRGLAIDARGDVWVGAHGSQEVVHLDGQTGVIIDRIELGDTRPYGMAVDEWGYVWIASRLGSETVVRYDPALDVLLTFDTNEDIKAWPYGIAADGNGRVWFGSERSHIFSINTDTLEYGPEYTVGTTTRGLAVDDEGKIWVADSSEDAAIRVDPDDGEILASVMVPSEPVGVAIDHDGFLWAVSQIGETASKIDMNGRVVDTVEGLNSPYTYSDMTGSAFRVFRRLRGLYQATFGNGVMDSRWTQVRWTGEVPDSTSVVVRLRAGNFTPLDGEWTEVEFTDASAPLDLVGRSLEVQIVMTAEVRDEVPYIDQLQFEFEEGP